MKSIGDRLDELMQAHPFYRGRGQSALARDAGVPQPTINRILSDKSVPEMATATKLAQRFDVTVEWLLTGRGPKSIHELPHRDLPESPDLQEIPKNVMEALQTVLTAFRMDHNISSADLRTIIWYALTPVKSGSIAHMREPALADDPVIRDLIQATKERAAEAIGDIEAGHVEHTEHGKRKRR